MMMELDNVEKKILGLLKGLKDDGNYPTIPTTELYVCLYDAGVELGLRPYGSRLKKRRDVTTSEWLYDFSWWKIVKGITHPQHIEVLELALESEKNGNVDSVVSDFRKLIQSRARHRVMLFHTALESTAERCWQMVKDFADSSEGDRYLMIQWTPKNIMFSQCVVPTPPSDPRRVEDVL